MDTKEKVGQDIVPEPATEGQLAKRTGLDIVGLEAYDSSILPIPFVRVVQGQSKETKLANGQDAPEGVFLFDDTKEAVEILSFCMLKSKPVTAEFEREGKFVPTPQQKVLGITLDTKKVFILTISLASFTNFRRLIALLKHRGAKATWEYRVTATTQKTENEKGKFWVIHFDLGEKLQEADIIEMGLAFEEYRRVLDDSKSGEKNETE